MSSELWQRIRAVRKHMGLNQDDFGAKFGVTKAAVSQWESLNPENRTQPGWDKLVKMSEISSAPREWLMSDDSDCDAQFWLSTDSANSPIEKERRQPLLLETYGAQLMNTLAAIQQHDLREVAFLSASQLLLDHVVQAAKQPQLPPDQEEKLSE